MFSRIYLALFSQKYVSFSKSRRTDGNITVSRDGEGWCGRYCLLLEISCTSRYRGFDSHRLRQINGNRAVRYGFRLFFSVERFEKTVSAYAELRPFGERLQRSCACRQKVYLLSSESRRLRQGGVVYATPLSIFYAVLAQLVRATGS